MCSLSVSLSESTEHVCWIWCSLVCIESCWANLIFIYIGPVMGKFNFHLYWSSH